MAQFASTLLFLVFNFRVPRGEIIEVTEDWSCRWRNHPTVQEDVSSHPVGFPTSCSFWKCGVVVGFAKGIIAYFVFYVVPCSSQVFEKEKKLFCSHLRVGMQRLIIFFSIASIAIVLRAVVSSASSCILRYLQRQIMASWKNWSTWATWDYTSHPNDDSATHNWNDWDWT